MLLIKSSNDFFFSYAEIDAISQRRKWDIEMPSLVKLLCIENHLFQDCRKFLKLASFHIGLAYK